MASVVEVLVFFLQAEDGIRDRVRSRGLGDVYKRQEVQGLRADLAKRPRCWFLYVAFRARLRSTQKLDPVSYTHLTLPTSDLV